MKGLAKLAGLRDMMALRDYVDEGPLGRRRLPVLASESDDESDEDEDEDEDLAEDSDDAAETERDTDAEDADGDAGDTGQDFEAGAA